MFTGIVQDMGRIAALQAQGGDLRLTIEVSRLSLADARTGDSIAVSGVCLTALELTSKTFSADVSNETLSLTTLGQLRSGDQVNLEPCCVRAMPSAGIWCPVMSMVWPKCSPCKAMRVRSGCAFACRPHSRVTSRAKGRSRSTA